MRRRRLNFWQGLLITIFAGLLTLAITDRCFAQTELTIGQPYPDSVSSDGEEKYYQVNVSSGQHLFVMMEKEARWSSYLYIRHGTLPTSSDYDDRDSGSADLAVEIANTQSGYYYIMVRSGSSSGGTYTITAHNNSTLPTLSIGSSTSGSLSWFGDTQYYQVNVSSGQHLFVMMEKEARWSSYLYIRHGTLPTSSDYDDRDSGSADLAVEIANTQSGYYYIMVRSGSSSGGSYTILAKSHLSPENPDIQYSYDQLGRLKGVTYPSGGQIEYTYDERGNRLEYVVTKPPCVADFDGDGDVDGSDLAALAANPDLLDLSLFAADFGRTDCP